MTATNNSLQHIVIAGLGATGYACLSHLMSQGRATIAVIDSSENPPFAERARQNFPQAEYHLGVDSLPVQFWERAELLVVSPGIAPRDALLGGSTGVPRCSDIDLFMAATRAAVVGITGTNGKSTATSLLGHMLGRLGQKVSVGGNLGEPALTLLDARADVYVLELSSFQLEYSTALPLTVGAVLNVSVDHLDRHGSLEAYAAVKRGIFQACVACVYNADDPATNPADLALRPLNLAGRFDTNLEPDRHLVSFGTAADAPFRLSAGGEFLYQGEVFARAADFKLRGRHNLLNLLAAMAMIDGLAGVGILRGLESFQTAPKRYVESAQAYAGLPHRCELVAEIEGVSYINDSKATNVGACIAALEGLVLPTSSAKVLLLAGGQAKGATFTELTDVARRRVKKALLFGEDAPLLERALTQTTSVERCASLQEAVQRAYASATHGDSVLLAPACASFDMFDNFAARGEAFRSAVASL